MTSRLGGWVALSLSQLQPVALVTCVVGTLMTATDDEIRPISSPNSLWTGGVFLCVLLGVLLVFIAQRIRPEPRWPWQVLPGIDSGFVEHFANRAGVAPRPWLVIGWLCWPLLALGVVALFVYGIGGMIWDAATGR